MRSRRNAALSIAAMGVVGVIGAQASLATVVTAFGLLLRRRRVQPY